MKICSGKSHRKIIVLFLIVAFMFVSGCSSVSNYKFNGVQLGKQYAQAEKETTTDATTEEKAPGEKSWFAQHPKMTIFLGILAAGAVYYGLAASGVFGSGAAGAGGSGGGISGGAGGF
ncbi:MAG: hypothetical protein PHU49_00280 [Syntrophorhabdaceae bacterium]|nr:hypothetical protein [Syntrophorhabdaceae bacterium]